MKTFTGAISDRRDRRCVYRFFICWPMFFCFESDGFRSLPLAVRRERRRWFSRSLRTGFALDAEGIASEAARAACDLPENSYEKELLGGLLLMARNDAGDADEASRIFGRIVRAIESDELPESPDFRRVGEHVFEMYVLALYAHASSHYYRERDLRSLRVFSRCLDVLSARGRRSVGGVVFAEDVRRKVASIAFLHDSESGYGLALRLMRSGDCEGAIRLFDRVIRETKCDCLDHEVLLSAAVAHFLVGDEGRGRALARSANSYTRCLEAQFVYALSLLARGNGVSRRRALDLLRDCASAESEFRCQVGSARRNRIGRVIDDLIGHFCQSDADAGRRESDFVQGGEVNVPECLLFVYRNGAP